VPARLETLGDDQVKLRIGCPFCLADRPHDLDRDRPNPLDARNIAAPITPKERDRPDLANECDGEFSSTGKSRTKFAP
jgi:hypothetical protein